MGAWDAATQMAYHSAADRLAEYSGLRFQAIAQLLSRSGTRHLQELCRLDGVDAEFQKEGARLDAEQQAVIRAFSKRWEGVTISESSQWGTNKRKLGPFSFSDVYLRGVGKVRNPADATDQMRAYQKELQSARMPFRAGSKARTHSDERNQLDTLLDDTESARQFLKAQLDGVARSRQELIGNVCESVRKNSQEVPARLPKDTVAAEELRRAAEQTLPPGVADRGGRYLGRTARASNSLTAQVGYLVEQPLQLTFVDGSEPTKVRPAVVATPAVLDIAAAGGFVTDSKDALTSVIVRLLALNPPGALKLQVFDRNTYGKVIDYILDLEEDVQKVILTSPIATTVRDLESCLDDAEGRIGFVTQKYLAGKHKSLAEYNLSADGMTEPTRLLVLTGYPDGFTRSHGVDEDLVDQLHRIVKRGPAAGVHTLILTSSSERLPRLPALRQGQVDSGGSNWPADWVHLAQRRSTPQPSKSVEELRRAGASSVFGLSSFSVWQPSPPIPPADIQEVMRSLADDVRSAPARQVDPANVAALAAKEGHVVDPQNHQTWWKMSSQDAIEAPVGTRGTSDVQTITFASTVANNGLLVGGQSGSGKSTFLHALITELCRRYSPYELQLCLVDLKNGVEFSAYRDLPHARIVGLKAGTEFGTAVLGSLRKETEQRTKLFNQAGVASLKDYRAATGAVMPRVVLVIDEFTFAFEQQGPDNTAFRIALERILKQGRSYGIHCVLATQSIAHGFDVPRDTLREIPMRVALRSDKMASRLLLSDNNPAAEQIEHAGEALFNGSHGQPSGNVPFQTAWIDKDGSTRVAAQLAEKWRGLGRTTIPRVFDTSVPAPYPTSLAAALSQPRPNGPLQIPLGLPFGLGEPTSAELTRASGGNLLCVVPEETAVTLTASALTSCLSAGSKTVFVDFGGLGSPSSTATEPIISVALAHGHTIFVPRADQVGEALAKLSQTARDRQDHDKYTRPSTTLILTGLERAGLLRSDSSAQESLQSLISLGPEVGLHTVVVTERYTTFEQKVGMYSLQEFENRVIGPLDSSQSITLADTSDTSGLSQTQLLYYDKGRGRARRVLAFDMPPNSLWGTTP